MQTPLLLHKNTNMPACCIGALMLTWVYRMGRYTHTPTHRHIKNRSVDAHALADFLPSLFQSNLNLAVQGV